MIRNAMLRKGTALAAILALSLVLAACSGSTEEPTRAPASPTPPPAPTATATPQAEPTPAEKAAEEAVPSEDPIDLVEHLREKAAQLWEVYNAYDADGLAVFYEPSYWAEEENEVRSNLQPFRNLELSITAEETSPPTEIEPGKWEIKQTARWSSGSVKLVFIYEEFGGEWLLTYLETE